MPNRVRSPASWAIPTACSCWSNQPAGNSGGSSTGSTGVRRSWQLAPTQRSAWARPEGGAMKLARPWLPARIRHERNNATRSERNSTQKTPSPLLPQSSARSESAMGDAHGHQPPPSVASTFCRSCAVQSATCRSPKSSLPMCWLPFAGLKAKANSKVPAEHSSLQGLCSVMRSPRRASNPTLRVTSRGR